MRREYRYLGRFFIFCFYFLCWPILLIVLLVTKIKQAYERKETKKRFNKQKNLRRNTYEEKNYFMTNCETDYFNAFRTILGENYIVQPQINLASIIDKPNQKYRGELFRNIDFGIFDKTYRLLLLIEINDKTHKEYNRAVRDKKVLSIYQKVGIPLITFWVHGKIDLNFIRNKLSNYIMIPQNAISASQT